jgi:acetyl-CoA carboxylase carboxyltransferase component
MSWQPELDELRERDAKMAEIEERLQKLRSPFRATETFWVEEMIDPRDTRRLAVDFARLADKLRQSGESKFCMRP